MLIAPHFKICVPQVKKKNLVYSWLKKARGVLGMHEKYTIWRKWFRKDDRRRMVSVHCWWESKLVQAHGKRHGGCLEKVKISMGSSNSASGDTHEGNEITIWRNYLYCHVHCSLICNSQGQGNNLSVHWQMKDRENNTYVMEYHSAFKKKESLGIPDGPSVRTLYFHCRGPGFYPLSGN